MANRREVLCINKSNRTSAHERITHIGGSGWRITQQEAIQAIENDPLAFFVRKNGREVNLIVAKHNGNKYVKTVADGEQPDNLLSLPECSNR